MAGSPMRTDVSDVPDVPDVPEGQRIVERFERRLADYCGAPYGIAVDTCTMALFLCFKRLRARVVRLPCRTYLGVACAALHAGAKLELCDVRWQGMHAIDVDGTRVIDSACRLRRGMFALYTGTSLMCLSFQYRKHLKIGRGGMILTDDPGHAAWFRKARYCGRSEPGGVPHFVGYHAYIEPERAARGLSLLEDLPDDNPDLVFDYPDLASYAILTEQAGYEVLR